jgi:S1-C subfamily serine protease
VDPAGIAADAGLQPGDVVKKVNGREVETVQDLRTALDTHKDAPALVLVSRNGATVFVALPHAES